MSSYTITGTVVRIGETAQVSERFSKRAIHITATDNPKYPRIVELEATGDKCALLDDFQEGDVVTIDWNLRGREWSKPGGEVRVFNTLAIWKIELAAPKRETRRAPPRNDSPAPPETQRAYDDDLPFATCELGAEPSPIWRPFRA